MKKNIFLNIGMTAIFICLMSTFITGIKWHEILGLVVFGLFFVHKFLNRKWIVAVTKKIFSKEGRVPATVRIQYVIDAVLLVLVTFIIISGILISIEIFPQFQSKNLAFWSSLHHFASILSLILISVHVGLNWQQIINTMKRIFGINTYSKVRMIVCRVLAVVIMLAGIKGFASSNAVDFLKEPFEKGKAPDTDTGAKAIKQQAQEDTNEKQSSQISGDANSEETPTLEKFLDNMVCHGCGKLCPLLALRCSKGNQYQQDAIEQYYEQYPSADKSQSEGISSSSQNYGIDEQRDMKRRPDSFNSDDRGNGFKNGPFKGRSDLSVRGKAPADNNTSKGKEDEGSNNSKGDYNIRSFDREYRAKGDGGPLENNKVLDGLEYLSIMGLFVGGTHYIVSFSKRNSKLPTKTVD